MGRSTLFTEHTTSAVLPVLSRRRSVGQLLRLWSLVLLANVVGGARFARGATPLDSSVGVADASAFGEIVRRVVEQSWDVMLLSAVGTGWLMGLLTWLTTAARDTISQPVVI